MFYLIILLCNIWVDTIVKLIEKECYLISINNYILTVKNKITTAKLLKSLKNNLIIIFSITVFEKDKTSEQISIIIEAFL